MIQGMGDDKLPPFGGSVFLDGKYLGEANSFRFECDNWRESEALPKAEEAEWPDVIGEEG